MKNPLRNSLMTIAQGICARFPVATVRLRYLLRFGRLPNLRQPRDLNEKILHLKLFSDTSQWTVLADKLRVRDYVEACGLGDILVPIYGAWERVEDIPFNQLPERFMLKANNGDGRGTNLMVDKAEMTAADWQRLHERLQRWLTARHVGALSAEPQYRDIPPRIVAEQLLPVSEGQRSLVDYKLWCFGGQPHSFLVCSNRSENGYEVEGGSYDLEWNFRPQDMRSTAHMTVATEPQPRPRCLSRMIEIGRTLSKPFPQVRVDLYEVDGKVYFGELTFTSLGGMMNYYTDECLQRMGEQVKFAEWNGRQYRQK